MRLIRKKRSFHFLLIVVLLLLLVFFAAVVVYAHPGRTDSNGGHYNHSTGEYHYHDGLYAGQSNGSTSQSNTHDSLDFEEYTFDFDKFDELDSYPYSKAITATPTPSPTLAPKAENAKTPVPTWIKWVIGILVALILSMILWIRTLKHEIRSLNQHSNDSKIRHERELTTLKEKSQKAISDMKAAYDEKLDNSLFDLNSKHWEDIDRIKEQHKERLNIQAAALADAEYVLNQFYGDDFLLASYAKTKDVFLTRERLPSNNEYNDAIPWGKDYTFLYTQITPQKRRLHNPTCPHALNAKLINAYDVKNSDDLTYIYCKVCQPKLPDVSWVDEYKKTRNTLYTYEFIGAQIDREVKANNGVRRLHCGTFISGYGKPEK